MRAAVIGAGLVAEMAGWWLVATGRRDVWRLMPLILGPMGIAALLVAPATAPQVGRPVAFGVGLAAGLTLFLGTRVFVWVASAWEPFRRDTLAKYREAAEVPLRTSLVLSLLVMVPAEELFWRGLAQQTMAAEVGAAGGAAAAWALYVVANLPSRSLPIVAGAVVGGAAWAGLGWWSGGVLAPLASHILWTGLMLALPPGAGRKERA